MLWKLTEVNATARELAVAANVCLFRGSVSVFAAFGIPIVEYGPRIAIADFVDLGTLLLAVIGRDNWQ